MPFDASATWRRLLRNVVLTFAGCSVFLAAFMFFAARADWWQGYLAATIASALAAAASLVPLNIGLKRGYTGLMAGFLAASGVRFAIAIGLVAFAVGVGGYPKIPTFVLVMPYYLATLAVEAWSLTRLHPQQ